MLSCDRGLCTLVQVCPSGLLNAPRTERTKPIQKHSLRSASGREMLRYVTLNIFESPAQTLANTVNTVGIMGKGIAADYKKRYPEMFHRYAEFCANGMLTTGRLYLYRSPNKWVLNFPTKRHWRNPSKVEYIEDGLKKFVATWAEYGITSISFPQLGTGNGGLDWKKDVQPLMERYLKDLPLPIYIHVAKTRADFVPEHKNAVRTRATVDVSSRLASFWRRTPMSAL